MNLIRWEPFSAMDDIFGRFPSLAGRWPRFSGSSEKNFDWSPSVDISETGTEYLIRATLPAVKKEDVSVTFEDGMLTLSGERRQQEDLKDEKFHRIESFYGNFSRSFTLPDAIDSTAIRAESKDGVVTVHVPKREVEVKHSKSIKVQ